MGFYSSAQGLTEIYTYDVYGTRSLFPKAVVEDNSVYGVSEYGVIDIFPSYMIEPSLYYSAPIEKVDVYKVDYFGNISLFPEYRIEVKEPVVEPTNYFSELPRY